VYAAYNRNLDETILNDQGANDQISHSEVHAWYYGTIDPDATEDELAAMIAEEEANRSPSLNKTAGAAITIDRALWYADDLGITEGFAHSDHGGSLPFVDSLAQLDPTPPAAPYYDNKTDAFFDGNFFYAGNDVTNGGNPAWESQGGGGSGSIQDEQLVLTATSSGGNRSRTHNWFYLSGQVSALQFAIDVISSGDASLEVRLGDQLLDSWPVISLTGISSLSIDFTDSEDLGYTNTLTFTLGGTPTNTVEIIIDDIEIVFPENSLTLLSPNGGETWLVNQEEEIRWTMDGSFDTFTLEYSINGGNDWLLVDDNISGTSSTYMWSVPDNPAENCLMQVNGYFDGQNVSDISNNPFAISLTSGFSGTNRNAPEGLYLFTNFPNPFNPGTRITYQLPVAGTVHLTVFNNLGRHVQTLINTYKDAGKHSVFWQPQDLSSGVFYLSIEIGRFRQVRKIIYLK
jgi:hypothetical protein